MSTQILVVCRRIRVRRRMGMRALLQVDLQELASASRTGVDAKSVHNTSLGQVA